MMIALTLTVLGTLLMGAFALYRKDNLFILRDVTCEGNGRLSKNELLDLLNLELGVRLIDVPVEETRTRLLEHPWIKEVSIKRRFPSRLKVILEEKQAVALCYLEREKRWFGLDEKGGLLPGILVGSGDYPVLEKVGSLKESQLEAIGGFLRDAAEYYPGIYNAMSQIVVGKKSEITIFSRDSKFCFRVSLEENSQSTLEMWQLLISQKHEEFINGGTIDLRVRGYAYVS
jgi:cell division septal protein FtsQ